MEKLEINLAKYGILIISGVNKKSKGNTSCNKEVLNVFGHFELNILYCRTNQISRKIFFQTLFSHIFLNTNNWNIILDWYTSVINIIHPWSSRTTACHIDTVYWAMRIQICSTLTVRVCTSKRFDWRRCAKAIN